MPDTGLGDHEVELILSGSTIGSDDLADVEGFVAVMSKETQPPEDVSHMATRLAALARSPRRPRTLVRRLAPVAASVVALLALSGVAMAADRAVPGDALFGIDQAMERIGIGDGGAEERIAEFDTVLAAGDEAQAFEFLATYMESAEGADADRAQQHLELAVSETDTDSATAQARVTALKDFIQQNRGRGVGLDGKEFGQRVSEIARTDHESAGDPNDPPPDTEEQDSTGRPDDAGQRDDAGRPDNPGPPDDTGPPDDAGPPADAGQSDNAGPPDDPGPPDGNQPGPPADTEPANESEPASSGNSGSSGNGPPEGTGGGQGQSGPPDHAGPKGDKEPGKPDKAGPKK